MCAIEDEHQRLAAIEPYDQRLEEKTIVLVNRSSFLMCAIEGEYQRLTAIEPHDRSFW